MKKMQLPKSKCGKTHSANGKPFSAKRLQQHELTCNECNSPNPNQWFIDAYDDLPDGAFFALADEMGVNFHDDL